MLDFLNQYSSAIQAISSIVMIIVTATLVYITNKYVKYTFHMAEEMKIQNRPNVFLDFDMFEEHFDLSISNIGNRTAHNVAFELIEDIENSRGEKLSDKEVIRNGISYFPPQRRFIFDFDFARPFLSKGNKKFLYFRIKYRDSNGKEYKDEFKYDLTIYSTMYVRSFSDSGSAISSALKGITRTLKEGLPDMSLKNVMARFNTK